jgi:hypothetical protein
MTSAILDILLKVFLVALPVILTWVFTKFGLTRIQYQKWQWAVNLIGQLIYTAAARFPDNSGPQKMKFVYDEFIKAAIKIGYHAESEEVKDLIDAQYKKAKLELGVQTLSG